MDYSREVVFSDSEPTLVEKTKKLLQQKFTRKVLNSERKVLRDRYSLSKVAARRTPQLDPVMKSEVSATTKFADMQLARLQNLLLDSLAPLTPVLECHNIGSAISVQAVIGNANANLRESYW